MPLADEIRVILTDAFQPESLEIKDESHFHKGHAGYREGGETHFRIAIVSDAFAGSSRVQRHRMVNKALSKAFDSGLHALAISAKSPGE